MLQYLLPKMFHIIEALMKHAPEVLQMEDCVGALPLHSTCYNGAPLKIVKALVKADFDSVKEILRETGALPLHLACETEFESPLEVIDFLAESYPDALDAKNYSDKTPSDILRQQRFSGFSK
mmetsp:Transcript_18002/g.25654  ORF Transcript_18002/g.25654 Transcript_18002/m.25654 type:complete len:122 (+) Transcript_18002:123-488(+)